VTPYYADDQVTLWHGDCREITAWLEADVLVTDPPYGRAWSQGYLPGHTSPNIAQPIANDQDTGTRDDALRAWAERPAVVFGDLMLAPPRGTKLVAVYRKPPDAGLRGAIGGFRRDAEAVYLTGKWPSGIGGASSVLTTGAATVGNPVGLAARYGHPHAKPVDVLERLIAHCPPGVIADPFAGSGSTLLAARAQGRRALAVEIDERYCEVIAKRLAQGDLFGGVA
jgi:hypothetical protein